MRGGREGFGCGVEVEREEGECFVHCRRRGKRCFWVVGVDVVAASWRGGECVGRDSGLEVRGCSLQGCRRVWEVILL